ncbi:hypothetical protein C1T31_05165 [Hanstruepera neustonica]|uniref:Glycosyltransferase 2-like domain-containing protein n=1 Tax=Hanstruepera neustonica TaxID=1445657 RepID=A0A2K1E0C3_9FLAO|nr:glycosyltransferase [Hanstruepera neustonica]PNQ73726.1 hypothetical protein C1T31_05165 [Hanstruepera neustonica]
MISVLIPTYNYSILELVNSISKQLAESHVAYEIICFEDGSGSEFIDCNNEINKLPYTQLLVSNENLGRIKARQALSDNAQYDWLLFLDADVLPKANDFILNYINQLDLKSTAVFGGIAYKKSKPPIDYMLRWKYGILKEETIAAIRNRKPYRLIASANMLIKKDVFNSINKTITYQGYGMDNYFGSKLKEGQFVVNHIDNPVFHLGLEKSANYLKKKEEAANTLLYLLKSNSISASDNNLLHLFLKLKQWKLNYIVAFLFSISKTPIKSNLLGKNPSIKLLQFYRIGYMCFTDLNSNNLK